MANANKKSRKDNNEDSRFPLPIYNSAEDIYNKEKEIPLEDPDATGEEEEKLGNDLDIPGSEYDDPGETIGEEDEENNYYSLGGDNHEDLEEGNSDLYEPE